MSRSLARVEAALAGAGLAVRILQMPGETRTALQAAEAAGCTLDQIVKSLVFRGIESGHARLFLTAGGNRIANGKASSLAGEALAPADAALIRRETGFAIGGVAPLGHLKPIAAWFDPRLMAFDTVWAAAGTPRHIFAIPPAELLRITGAVMADFVA